MCQWLLFRSIEAIIVYPHPYPSPAVLILFPQCCPSVMSAGTLGLWLQLLHIIHINTTSQQRFVFNTYRSAAKGYGFALFGQSLL